MLFLFILGDPGSERGWADSSQVGYQNIIFTLAKLHFAFDSIACSTLFVTLSIFDVATLPSITIPQKCAAHICTPMGVSSTKAQMKNSSRSKSLKFRFNVLQI